MRVGIFSDVHIHPLARFSTVDSNGMNSWVGEALEVMHTVYRECKTRSIDHVWFLGDLFETGTHLRTDVFNAVFDFFYERHKEDFVTTLVAGNHDQIRRGDEESALATLRMVATVVEHATFAPRHQILFLPYTEDAQVVERNVRTYRHRQAMCETQAPHIVVGHLALEGAKAGRFEYQPQCGCSPSIFQEVDLVLLGHYHKRQSINNRIHYVGSATAHNFGDSGEEKGFEILDTTTLEREFVPIVSTGFTVIESGSNPTNVDVWNRIVRVDYTGAFDEASCCADLLERGAKVIVFNQLSPRVMKERVVSDGEEDPTLLEYISAYVEEKGEGFDRERLVAVGLDTVQGSEG